jgi:hypothetical protein
MEQNGGSRCNSEDERHVLQYLHLGGGGGGDKGREYALINIKHSNAIPEYPIMCIKVGECKYCNCTIYYRIPILTYEYMQM